MQLERLNEARKWKKVTILELSRNTGINRNSLSKILKADIDPTISQIESICQVLGYELRLLIKTQ